MKKLIILLVLIVFNIKSQTVISEDKHVAITFNIFLDHKKIETDSVFVGMVTHTREPMYIRITDEFTTFLEPNRTYNMVITHPNYNRQSFRIIPDSTYNKKLSIDIILTSNTPDCDIGYMKYNKLLKKYIIY